MRQSSRLLTVLLLLSSLLLAQEQVCTPARAQAQPVIATDYSFYTGPLDTNQRPITRVNGYLRNESRAFVYVAISYLADMPQVVGIGCFYGPAGDLVQEQRAMFNARKAGESLVSSFGTDKISQVKNNTGIWRVDVYYGPYLLFIEHFSVGDYLVNVAVAGFPSKYAVNVAIDGQAAGTIRGGEEKPSAPTTGTHIISVNGALNTTSERRYVTLSNSRIVSSHGSVAFEYRTEYYLSVNSPYGNATGSGWYGQGNNATFLAQSPIVKSPGVRYVFTNWSGSYTGHDSLGVVGMDGPKNVTANYEVQFYLKVESRYDSPKGEGWYDRGSTASVSVLSIAASPYGTKVFFVRWSGDITSSKNNVTIVMNKPYSVVAEWRVEEPALRQTQSVYVLLGTYALLVAVAVVVLFLWRRKR